MVTILIPSSISENRIPVLPPCFLRGIKAPPPPLSHLALRERGWDNGERRHYIKTNETANQTNMQNRNLVPRAFPPFLGKSPGDEVGKTDICISFSHKKILFRQERMVSNVLTKTVVQGFGWDLIKNKKEISIVSNKTMLIMWLKIFSLGHLAVVENWITGLDLLRDCLRNGSINCVFK